MDLSPEEFAAQARAVASRAAALIQPGMRLGLGSGRMATAFVEALRPRVDAGLRVSGLCTSRATEDLAREVGIGLLDSSEGELDLDVDGADEYDESLNLLKGGGGALLREKVVAQRSRRFWVLADASKRVHRLGSSRALPIEVLSYDWSGTAALCESRLGGRAERRPPGAEPFISDNGNFVLDLHLPRGLDEPKSAAGQLAGIAGVLGHGLFLGLATAVMVVEDGEVKVLGDLERHRPTPPTGA
ncbi:MAG: ribose-5-phosphate isomerase RpiA [Candidatus Dormibacteria bacterium]